MGVNSTLLVFPLVSIVSISLQQLARVVEGWKKRDTEKEEQLEHARQEKEEVENKLKKQEQVNKIRNTIFTLFSATAPINRRSFLKFMCSSAPYISCVGCQRCGKIKT